jgi:hypothetical protein
LSALCHANSFPFYTLRKSLGFESLAAPDWGLKTPGAAMLVALGRLATSGNRKLSD